MKRDILVSEVGPRDGLQSIKTIMPLAAKKAWISALAASGLREIEVGSFVPAQVLPQLADTAEVVAHALTIPNLTVAVLVPNLRGAEAAVRAGAHKLTIPFSASETHSLKNVRRTHAQMFDEVRGIVALLAVAAREDAAEARRRAVHRVRLHLRRHRAGRQGCQARGATGVEAGCDEVGLADSVGFANPAQVRDLVVRVRAVTGKQRFAGLHLHNTRGLGLANVVAGTRGGRRHLRQLDGGNRRLPVRAWRDRQHRHRRSRLHARGDGPQHRHRSRQADCGTQDPRGGGARRRTVWLRASGGTAAWSQSA